MATSSLSRFSTILTDAALFRPPNPVGGRGPRIYATYWMASSTSCVPAASGGICPTSGLSALAHRVRLYARLSARRGVGEYSPPLRGDAARGRRAGSQSHGSHYRHSEREDYGERRPARLGCREAAEGAQAAYRGGHGRAVARYPRPCGRYSGCRWPRRPPEAPETTLCLAPGRVR